MKKLSKWLEFALMAGRLKRTVRTGWTRYGIQPAESVAEHSFRTAVLALVLADELGVDRDRAVRMALVHDLGEAVIGDLVTNRWGKPLDNLDSKLAQERAAVHEIAEAVGSGDIEELFREFEAGKTREARAVNQLDKLEMAIQAYEYEASEGLDLREFYMSARRFVTDERLLGLLDELETNRP